MVRGHNGVEHTVIEENGGMRVFKFVGKGEEVDGCCSKVRAGRSRFVQRKADQGKCVRAYIEF